MIPLLVPILTAFALASPVDGGDSGTHASGFEGEPTAGSLFSDVDVVPIELPEDGGGRTTLGGPIVIPDAGIDSGFDPDSDGDGWENVDDCNPFDPSINPGAQEIIANGIDEDCDGFERCYIDNDGDGFGITFTANGPLDCSGPDIADNRDDCNDSTANAYPGAPEVCDGIDNDCDLDTDENVQITYYNDGDNDGFGAGDPQYACSVPSNGSSNNTDCDDGDDDVYPNANETCNGIDDDCDNDVDENVQITYYNDGDNDGYGAGQALSACSVPSTGAAANGDCDDSRHDVNPGENESCDGVDNDCDNDVDEGVQLTYFIDGDDDGWGTGGALYACSVPSNGSTSTGDCDDSTAARHPGNPEVCDGIDNDCDIDVDEGQLTTWYVDDDNDGVGAGDPNQSCTVPSNGSTTTNDCDDSEPLSFPGNAEVCDGVDNDCDGNTDENLLVTWYSDNDNDGFGSGTAQEACEVPSGGASVNGDCNETNGNVNPGANEVCNGIDDDCDGTTDQGASDAETFFADDDDDGFGDPNDTAVACAAPSGFVADSTDCDDANATSNPNGSEVCNGIDDDCNDNIDDNASDTTDWYLDGDNDGVGAGAAVAACEPPSGDHVSTNGDCDDDASTTFPGAPEQCNNDDDDCDGDVDEDLQSTDWFVDADGDGFGDPATGVNDCAQPAGTVLDNTDCDDSVAGTNPGADEVCDGVDNDCSGSADDDAIDSVAAYADLDGDGHGAPATQIIVCDVPSGYVLLDDDCNDNEPAAWSDRDEVCDGVDNDCDGVVDPPTSIGADPWYEDVDGDGYGNPDEVVMSCDPVSGYSDDGTDCDDLSALAFPGNDEVCDLIDNDCDGDIDEDAIDADLYYQDSDLDTYGDPTVTVLACAQIQGLSTTADDCDDTDPTTNPDAYDQCDDGIDNDCDDEIDENTAIVNWYADLDGDLYGVQTDVIQDCAKPDGYSQLLGDCDDDDSFRNPGADELCNGVDDDCDGTIDNDAIDGDIAYFDGDNDGYGDAQLPAVLACDLDGFATNGADCDDLVQTTNPGALELCNFTDDDCDGLVDNNAVDGQIWYPDGDNDGYGNENAAFVSCTTPTQATQNDGDCDDTRSDVHEDAIEVCDGVDNNCDGDADDLDPDLDVTTASAWWVDADGDTFGRPGSETQSCTVPPGAATRAGDCNDNDPSVNPDADDIPGDGIDQDCDTVDVDPDEDADGDGIPDYIEEDLGGDPNNPDSDGDGTEDGIEGTGDTDGDGLPDFIDDDDDNDGIPSIEEGDGDFDGDGLPDYLDTDSDGDDVPDLVEAGLDSDGDGQPDQLDAGGDDPDDPPELKPGCGGSVIGQRGLAVGVLALLPLAFRRRRAA